MATVISVALPEIAALMARLGDRTDAALHRAATSIGMRALTVVQQATRDAKAINTGHMLRAWKSATVFTPKTVGVWVGNTAPYSAVVEYGRRPGARMPPIEPLARWAQRKFRLPYEEARIVGIRIARSIAKKGIKGRFILTGPDTQGKFKKIMQEEVLTELMAAWGNTP